MKHHSPRRQHRKRRRRRWLTRCVLGLLVAAARLLLFVHVRGDDDAARPPDEVRHARRSRPGVDLLKAETTARWLVAMRDQEERASEREGGQARRKQRSTTNDNGEPGILPDCAQATMVDGMRHRKLVVVMKSASCTRVY